VRRRRRKVEEAVEAVLGDEAIPQGRLDDTEDVEALRAAIELRASRLGADLPSSEAVEAIRHRVLADDLEAGPTRSLSRRALLAAAGGAVAAGAAGVALDRAVFSSGSTTPSHTVAAELVPDDGEWVPVASAQQLAGGTTQRFAAAKLVGFVSQQDGAPVAVSGACTHLGCLLQADAQSGRLDCPCHRTAFSPDGRVVFSQLETAPAPLPRIKSRVRDGSVEVFVPKEV
jgi:cytochrome b6-f complex iron-sulfur subunit